MLPKSSKVTSHLINCTSDFVVFLNSNWVLLKMQTFSTLFTFDNLSRADFLYLRYPQGKYPLNFVGSGLFIHLHFQRLSEDVTENHGVVWPTCLESMSQICQVRVLGSQGILCLLLQEKPRYSLR